MKRNNLKLYFLLGLNLLLIISCADKKQIAYYQNINQVAAQDKENNFESKIQPDDLLMIVVSAPDPEAAAPFNLETISVPTAIGQTTQGQRQQQLYLVDANGLIQFPVLGEINVIGQTKTQIVTLLKNKLIYAIKDPIINMRIINFKVTVQGEVAKPGSFTIASERITLPEALSLAGDLTIYGKRNSVLLIREKNGVKTYEKIDITKTDFINSANYYLSQNDVIYVEPNKTKLNSSAVGPNLTIGISALSLVVTILALTLK